MAQNIKCWIPFDAVEITATADHATGELVHEGKWYGVCIDAIANTKKGMIAINPIAELPKADKNDIIASGDIIEFVEGGKVQLHNLGDPIGKPHAASPAGAETVLVKLMPELYGFETGSV